MCQLAPCVCGSGYGCVTRDRFLSSEVNARFHLMVRVNASEPCLVLYVACFGAFALCVTSVCAVLRLKMCACLVTSCGTYFAFVSTYVRFGGDLECLFDCQSVYVSLSGQVCLSVCLSVCW